MECSNATFPDVESWARHYVLTTELREKLVPAPVPTAFAAQSAPLRLERPGRPAELRAAGRRERSFKPAAFKDANQRARALHAFFHHELQAAELMCWALLAFSDAELEFRRGLLGICLDEIRHMNLYREQITRLGFSIGSFKIRDWFWRRVPACSTKLAFVSVMGMGFEAANLEHAGNFAAQFRAAGDEEGAAIQDQIAKEELGHVAFATRWFARWTGGCDFNEWSSQLPAPLSPWLMRGEPIATDARVRAGMPREFIAALAAYVPEPKGRQASSHVSSA